MGDILYAGLDHERTLNLLQTPSTYIPDTGLLAQETREISVCTPRDPERALFIYGCNPLIASPPENMPAQGPIVNTPVYTPKDPKRALNSAPAPPSHSP